MGILLETEISDLSQEEKNEVKNYILSNFSLPKVPKKEQFNKFLLNDKKNIDGEINFSLLNGIGNCTIDNLFSSDER